MNPLESEYWDSQAVKVVDLVSHMLIRDNISKRCIQIARLMEINFKNVSILEIGIGSGQIAAVIKQVYGPIVDYHATDVSKVFVEFCTRNYGVPVQHTDVKELPYPDRTFHFVFAFDSLEHVQPDDRPEGYAEIDRVMKRNACVILNIPMADKGEHDDRFDHPFTYFDFIELLRVTRAKLISYQVYEATYTNGRKPTRYAWAIGERHI